MASTSSRVVKTRIAFKGPGIQVNGLEAVPEGLWLSDQQTDRTYLVDYEGKVLTDFPSPARNASGTSFGAGSVWIASNVRPSMIYRHDPSNGQCLAGLHLPNMNEGGVHGIQWRPYGPDEKIPGAVERGPELHPTAPGGKPNRGPGVSGTLWVTRPGARVIDHIDAETGESLGQIPFPMPRSHGCYWNEDTNTISVAETFEGHIFTLDPKDGEVMDVFQILGIEVHGLTKSADGRIWIGDAASNMVSVVEP